MSKKLSIEEWMFALGVYPNLNSIEKYRMFAEMVYKFTLYSNDLKIQKEIAEQNLKNLQELSVKKKASFADFLQNLNVQQEMKKYQEQGILWVHLLSDDYPTQLAQIYNPPVVLFYQGKFDLIQKKTWLGVVGARQCSEYGIKAIQNIIPQIVKKSKNKIGIISGLAKGIDQKAHQETVKAKGKTIGVIGTGLDIYYPYQNKKIQQDISNNHLLLSEYPIGAKPLKFHFPERNRIISGISRGVLVAEAQKRSGSLITAYHAIDENRDVFALPGSIFEDNFIGTNRLIQLGAILVQNHEDILQEWLLI